MREPGSVAVSVASVRRRPFPSCHRVVCSTDHIVYAVSPHACCGWCEFQTDSDGKESAKRYIITFIDDYSRFAWIAITSDKTGETALEQFVRYKAWAERYTGFSINTLRTDGGGEYIHDQFNRYLLTMGIERQVTVARTPQQNGVAERANRTIMEAARAMLHAAGLPLSFWEYAVMAAVYLRNRSPTKALTDATPYEAWRGDKPDLSHLRVFGCRAYMHVDKTKRSKLQPGRSRWCSWGTQPKPRRGSCTTRSAARRRTCPVTSRAMRVCLVAHCSQPQ